MPDLFISHASEDKEACARPLATALVARGLDVWFDELTLRLGDSLAREIDRGLARCRFGIVILSPRFFAKEWPLKELDGLLARESIERTKRLLPVWHEVSVADVAVFSPSLAGRFAIRWDRGVSAVVDAIIAAMAPADMTSSANRSEIVDGGRLNLPPGYERQLNYHRFRIAKDKASRSPAGGYSYPVSVRGLETNIRNFVSEAVKRGAKSIGMTTVEGLSTASFDYEGRDSPENFEAIATSVGVQVVVCGKGVVT